MYTLFTQIIHTHVQINPHPPMFIMQQLEIEHEHEHGNKWTGMLVHSWWYFKCLIPPRSIHPNKCSSVLHFCHPSVFSYSCVHPSLCMRQRPSWTYPPQVFTFVHLFNKIVRSRFTISSPLFQNNWVKIHHRENKVR